MVFSFFKKKADKSADAEVMRPKPAFVPTGQKPAALPEGSEDEAEQPARREPLPDLEFSPGGSPATGKNSATKHAKSDHDNMMSEFDREFTESNVMAIDVEHGADSLQADIEQVAVLYANGQDRVVQPLLESLLGAYPGEEGVRLWWMLFDFLQLKGGRAEFEKLGVEFAQACETSPPAWREPEPVVAAAGASVATVVLKGVLTADSATLLEPLAGAIRERKPLWVDCSGLAGCDDAMSGRLVDLLTSARRQGVAIVLKQTEGMVRRLRARLTVGEAQDARSWLLLLELLQRHGTQEDFEQCAIDFAVTFERSPPSWEAVPAPRLPQVPVALPADDAHYLSGEIKNSRFDDLTRVLHLKNHVVLDFSAVRRLDFYSAGQLVNRLAPMKGSGHEVIIRSPNHLVAELMAVVGINKLARIIVPRS